MFSFGPAPLITLGAGTRWYLSERLSFRVDGLLHLWRIPTPTAFLTLVGEAEVGERRWARVTGFSAGMQLGF